MTEADIIQGIQSPGRFDATVGSEADARRLVGAALPHAAELPPAVAGQPYASAVPGVKAWFQVHPPEPAVGNDLPHAKYADWTGGKKGRGGSWGTLAFHRLGREGKEGSLMSFMFEVYYLPPANSAKEAALTEQVAALGGRLDYREGPDENGPKSICLTYEFDDLDSAMKAADVLRQLGEHVPGPVQDYGP